MNYVVMPALNGGENRGNDGIGVQIRKSITTTYLSEKDALWAANEKAKENPGTAYIVLESKYMVEAEKPKIVPHLKKFNDKGEVVPNA